MEMNTAAARELAVSMGFGMANKTFSFGIGGSQNGSTAIPLTSVPGLRGYSGTGIANVATTNSAGQPPTIGVLTNNVSPGLTGNLTTNNSGYVVQPVSFMSTSAAGTAVNGIGQGQIITASGLLSQSVLLGAPGGVSFSAANAANIFTANSSFGNGTMFSINPTVQGVISSRRARVLAEPTLVTLSGERASFLAGGEIPILQAVAAGGTAQQSVVFEPFGMRINMIPVLQENGIINLEVSPEERIIASNLSFSLFANGTGVVPGFTTRKTQTIVELKPGQELYIAGLVSTNIGREVAKLPIFGEVPVLGALYRSKAFNKNESELVVSVRPEIILPGTPGQLKLPEEIGRTEGPRDMNMFQVEPTVLDERHFTSGRAERHQKTSPTLPDGAPVPDNE